MAEEVAEVEAEETKASLEAVPSEEDEAATIADRDEDRRAQKLLQLHLPKRLLLLTRRTRRWQRLLPSYNPRPPTMTTTMAIFASSAPTPLPTTRLRRATTRRAISAACA